MSPSHKNLYSACWCHASVSDYIYSSCGHRDWPKGSVLHKRPYSCLAFVFMDIILWLRAGRRDKFNYNVSRLLSPHIWDAWSQYQFVGSNANHKKTQFFSSPVCNSNKSLSGCTGPQCLREGAGGCRPRSLM